MNAVDRIAMAMTAEDKRWLAERDIARRLANMLEYLPELEACDPWTLTTTQKRGKKVWVLEVACTERRENGYSNHARAEVSWTGRRIRVNWTHGQGHLYEASPGSSKSFRIGAAIKGQKYWAKDAFRFIQKKARQDSDIFIIR